MNRNQIKEFNIELYEDYSDFSEEFQMFARSELIEKNVVLRANSGHPPDLRQLVRVALQNSN